MRILYDHQAFSMQRYGGVSRYFTELIHGINHKTNHEAKLAAYFTNNEYANSHFSGLASFFPDQSFPGKTRLLYTLNAQASRMALIQKQFDVFHATYNDGYCLALSGRKPFVMTLHDLIHERFGPEYAEMGNYKHVTTQKLKMAHRADRIIAVSENTKRDAVNLLNINPDKIQVIYLGSSLKQTEMPASTLAVEPYLLFVGNRGQYKNFIGLLNAIHKILIQYKIKLICAGGGSFNADEQKKLNQFSIQSLVEQYPITDSSLKVLYQNALAFILPSRYEGFGIPVLEAFACGCACLLSNNSSLPEVAGDAALFFNPDNESEITAVVESVLQTESLRQDLRIRGYAQLAKFSWEQTISQTVSLYQSVVT